MARTEVARKPRAAYSLSAASSRRSRVPLRRSGLEARGGRTALMRSPRTDQTDVSNRRMNLALPPGPLQDGRCFSERSGGAGRRLVPLVAAAHLLEDGAGPFPAWAARREETHRFHELGAGALALPQGARHQTHGEVGLGQVGAGAHRALAERLRRRQVALVVDRQTQIGEGQALAGSQVDRELPF